MLNSIPSLPLRRAVCMLCLIVLQVAPAMCLRADEALVPSHQEVAAPEDLKVGLHRVQEVLGAYDPAQQIEWVRDETTEMSVRPDPAKPPIAIVLEGPMVVGHPMPMPDSVAFDVSSILSRQVFDVHPEKRTLTRVQRSHNVARISLTHVGGLWRYEETCLSNGVHSAIGKAASSGYVRWNADGFELVGTKGVALYYAAGGELLPRTSSMRSRYQRSGDELIVTHVTQVYEAARDSSGGILNVPDLTQPKGDPVTTELHYTRPAVSLEK